MADTKRKKKRNLKEAEAVEVHDDAWERFTSTIKKIVPGKGSSAKDHGKDRRDAE
jgi:hypothetical protein